MEPLRVDVWSDVACPCCHLGHAHLQAASRAAGIALDVRFRSYQLAPDMTGSRPANAYVEQKYGDAAMVEGMRQRLTAAGDAHGIGFDFERAVASNTFDAHRLHHFAMQEGQGEAVMTRLLRAMHEEGADMSDHAVLTSLAADAGLDADAVRDVLAGDAFADAVRADVEAARRMGVSGVPFFVVAGRWALSGAQPVEVFQQALRTAHQHTQEAPSV